MPGHLVQEHRPGRTAPAGRLTKSSNEVLNMATKDPTAPAGAQSAAPSPDSMRDITASLLQSIAVLEVLRDLLLAEQERGSKRIALEGVIANLYLVTEDIGAAVSAAGAVRQ